MALLRVLCVLIAAAGLVLIFIGFYAWSFDDQLAGALTVPGAILVSGALVSIALMERGHRD